MRCAYFQCANGASGDMTLGALVDAGVPLERLQEALDALGASAPRLEAQTVERAGIRATHIKVHISDEERESHHRPLRDLLDIVERSTLPAPIVDGALRVLKRLGEAEARVHGLDPETVTLAELGSADTLGDIVGAVAGLAALDVDAVYASALPLGGGRVQTHHGLLPVPVPGVLELVRMAGAPVVPSAAGDEPGELVTPTGAALLTTLATFEKAPTMTIEKIGYGAGTRDPKDRPNVLTLWVGEARARDGRVAEMLLVETTIDDMNPELYGHVRDVLTAQGARDVWLTPVQMKKGRPGIIISALTPPDVEGRVVDALLRETSTLGVRVTTVRRHEAERAVAEVVTSLGTVRVKLKYIDGRVVAAAPEHDDCLRLAQESGRPLREVYRITQRAADDRFLEA